jgi:hypothetical protein
VPKREIVLNVLLVVMLATLVPFTLFYLFGFI